MAALATLGPAKNLSSLATTPVKSFARSFARASQGVQIYISPVFNYFAKTRVWLHPASIRQSKRGDSHAYPGSRQRTKPIFRTLKNVLIPSKVLKKGDMENRQTRWRASFRSFFTFEAKLPFRPLLGKLIP